jgi:lactoylglutathione lyase
MEKTANTPELKVLNFQESLRFYTDLAGFEVLYDRPENNFAMLGINGSRLMIEELSEKSRTFEMGKLERPLGRGMHFQIRVSDAQQLADKFKSNNYPLFQGMEEKWYRIKDEEVGNKQFLVQDPDGYLLRFFEDIGARNYNG